MGKHFEKNMMGFSLTFENGWCIDASFGPGTYSDNHNMYVESDRFPESFESNTCAAIILDNEGNDRTYEVAKHFHHKCYEKCPELMYLQFNDWWKLAQFVQQIPKGGYVKIS